MHKGINLGLQHTGGSIHFNHKFSNHTTQYGHSSCIDCLMYELILYKGAQQYHISSSSTGQQSNQIEGSSGILNYSTLLHHALERIDSKRVGKFSRHSVQEGTVAITSVHTIIIRAHTFPHSSSLADAC